MTTARWLVCGAALTLSLAGSSLLWSQLAGEPPHESGQSVTGAFEGWFHNPDGSFSFLFGYNNRNTKEELDIPVGPDNNIEPGGPDQGQPTHFLTQRQMGIFTVHAPSDFGDKKLRWTLTANGKSTVIPASLNPLWEIEPYSEAGAGKTPPLLWLEPGNATGKGPIPIVRTLSGKVGQPVPLSVWVSDEAKNIPGRPPMPAPVVVSWAIFRGAGPVTFARARPAVEKGPDGTGSTTAPFSGKAATTATFPEPGEYTLEVIANGTRGFRCCCCWTNGEVKVTVGR